MERATFARRSRWARPTSTSTPATATAWRPSPNCSRTSNATRDLDVIAVTEHDTLRAADEARELHARGDSSLRPDLRHGGDDPRRPPARAVHRRARRQLPPHGRDARRRARAGRPGRRAASAVVAHAQREREGVRPHRRRPERWRLLRRHRGVQPEPRRARHVSQGAPAQPRALPPRGHRLQRRALPAIDRQRAHAVRRRVRRRPAPRDRARRRRRAPRAGIRACRSWATATSRCSSGAA